MVRTSIPLSERNRERTPEEKAAFADKLQHWRENGFPGVQTDECEPFQSMADGKTYTSKSEYRKELKAQGYVELGDQKVEAKKPKGLTDQEISDGIDKAAAQLGYSI